MAEKISFRMKGTCGTIEVAVKWIIIITIIIIIIYLLPSARGQSDCLQTQIPCSISGRVEIFSNRKFKFAPGAEIRGVGGKKLNC